MVAHTYLIAMVQFPPPRSLETSCALYGGCWQMWVDSRRHLRKAWLQQQSESPTLSSALKTCRQLCFGVPSCRHQMHCLGGERAPSFVNSVQECCVVWVLLEQKVGVLSCCNVFHVLGATLVNWGKFFELGDTPVFITARQNAISESSRDRAPRPQICAGSEFVVSE